MSELRSSTVCADVEQPNHHCGDEIFPLLCYPVPCQFSWALPSAVGIDVGVDDDDVNAYGCTMACMKLVMCRWLGLLSRMT